MDTEGNNEYDWGIIEKNIRRIYGNKAYRRITEDEWWRYKYCERRKMLKKQLARKKNFVAKSLAFSSFHDDPNTVVKKNRRNGQRSRWNIDRFSRRIYIEDLGSLDTVAHLLTKMSWHPHHSYIFAVALYPGVTSKQLAEHLGMTSSNHRMVFRRLNNDLYLVGWQFVSCQLNAQNKPWGWYLEKI
ncbi:hypothetical protein ACRDE1_002753 [Cronobacter sakazakii]|uniref:hypothetical protein n=1 Tax=Leclercia TaxID=83654 RepID=UPI00124C7561|nr:MULTISPECIES: hypothetical protein [Leclercia]MCE9985260.1 hypothetical protein [Leclercia adecarboxylata]QFH51542.1 hypothetical protein FR819_20660 [Leclercia adecarboxylata]UGB04378.1 hypothetical protein LRS40_10215 [Leclercia sp. G3L]